MLFRIAAILFLQLLTFQSSAQQEGTELTKYVTV